MSYLELARKALAAQRKAPDIQAHNEMAREALDRFFSEVILPRLTDLHKARKLPNLAHDPAWLEVEREWDKAAASSRVPCDIEGTKAAMRRAVEFYKAGEGQPGLFKEGGQFYGVDGKR